MATIAENLERIQSAKTDIKTAIEAKGVTVPSSATIDTYATYVSQISGGGAATPSNLDAWTYDSFGKITSAVIRSGVTSLNYINGFYHCTSLSSVTIPNSVTSIGNQAFQNCSSLTSVDIPNSVTSIGQKAFSSCSGLTSCTIGSGVTSIGDWAFTLCSGLTSCTIGSGVTSIGHSAFYHCDSLTNIDIPDSVTSIGDSAFNNCSSLTSITIPSAVTSIGEKAFMFCSSLTSITVNATTPPALDSKVFDRTNNCPIYVPEESVMDYRMAHEWSNYESRIQPIQ